MNGRSVAELSTAMGYPMHYGHPSEIMDEIARLTPTFAGVSYARLDELGSIQWPCNAAAPTGTPIMHEGGFARGPGKFTVTPYVPTDERTGPRFPLLLTTGRILSPIQCRRADTAHGQCRVASGGRARDPRARRRESRHSRWRLDRAGQPRRRDHACGRGFSERIPPGVVYTTFHHPLTGTNVITTDNSDWATNCPEYK